MWPIQIRPAHPSRGDGCYAGTQIDVDWDDGRTLMLSSPPDRFEIVDGGMSTNL
jgi:hypothetical protein